MTEGRLRLLVVCGPPCTGKTTLATGLQLKAPEGVRVAVCPMVQKPWLQKGDAIANPYYGKEMLTCGSLR